jgi:hypothetical protein
LSKNSVVKCEVCGRIQEVDFGYSLMKGWPQCHGYTMTLISHPTGEMIDRAVRGCIGNAEITSVQKDKEES